MSRPSPGGPRNQLDVAVHKLWSLQPEALLRLASGLPDAQLQRTLNEKLSAVRREVDAVALARGPHGPFYAHLEFHSDTSPGRVARQLLVNASLLYARHQGRHPVLSTAVLLDRRSDWGGELRMSYGPEPLVRAQFRVLRLYAMPAATLAAVPALAPLCPLGRGATLRDIGQAAATIRQSERRDERRLDALAILYITSGRRFDAASIGGLLWREELMRSSTFMEIYDIGQRQGVQQGVHQGVQQGLQQGQRTVLLRLMTRRFGPLPAAAVARIEHASLEQIEAWTDRLLDAPSLDALLEG